MRKPELKGTRQMNIRSLERETRFVMLGRSSFGTSKLKSFSGVMAGPPPVAFTRLDVIVRVLALSVEETQTVVFGGAKAKV